MKLAMVGRLSECLLLAYRVPPQAVRHLLPARLELVTHNGDAFWNVVACRVEKMRPAGLPAFCGVSYNHVAYRLYVRTLREGATDGLFFVRSDADSRMISVMGNVMTDFRFHASPITLSAGRSRVQCTIHGDWPGELLAEEDEGAAVWPPDSAFDSFEDAARFLKYRPVALSMSRRGRLKLASVHRHEPDWRERRVRVIRDELPFLDRCGPRRLELATRVDPLDYRWILDGAGCRRRAQRLGRSDLWSP